MPIDAGRVAALWCGDGDGVMLRSAITRRGEGCGGADGARNACGDLCKIPNPGGIGPAMIDPPPPDDMVVLACIIQLLLLLFNLYPMLIPGYTRCNDAGNNDKYDILNPTCLSELMRPTEKIEFRLS